MWNRNLTYKEFLYSEITAVYVFHNLPQRVVFNYRWGPSRCWAIRPLYGFKRRYNGLGSSICKYNQITCHIASNIHCNVYWFCYSVALWLVVRTTQTQTQILEILTISSAPPNGLILNLIIQISCGFQFKSSSSSLMGLQHSLSMQIDFLRLTATATHSLSTNSAR